jgi:hypothetical protein
MLTSFAWNANGAAAAAKNLIGAPWVISLGAGGWHGVWDFAKSLAPFKLARLSCATSNTVAGLFREPRRMPSWTFWASGEPPNMRSCVLGHPSAIATTSYKIYCVSLELNTSPSLRSPGDARHRVPVARSTEVRLRWGYASCCGAGQPLSVQFGDDRPKPSATGCDARHPTRARPHAARLLVAFRRTRTAQSRVGFHRACGEVARGGCRPEVFAHLGWAT